MRPEPLPGPRVGGRRSRRWPSKVTSPRSGVQQSGDAVEQRRLAGAVGTDDPGDLTGLGLESDAPQRLDPPKQMAMSSLEDYDRLPAEAMTVRR